MYDFSYLTRTFDLGESSEFVPLGGTDVIGMLQAAETEHLKLYIDPLTTTVAVFDKRNGHTWYSNPPDSAQDPVANPFQKNMMQSNLGFEFFCGIRRTHGRWLYNDSVAYDDQFEIAAIPNGVRITYQVGDMDLGINAIPFFMETERFNERVSAQADPDDWARVRRFWFESQEREGFMQMSNPIRERPIDSGIMIRIFDEIGYTLDELAYDNAAAGVELDVEMNFFRVVMEFKLEDDRLKVNIPLEEFRAYGDEANVSQLDLLPFFGAGGLDDEGFIFVPSGSGGIINFNNGKHMEAEFRAPVYGADYLTTSMHPQVVQPVRLPVLGIKNNDAAMIAHVYSGQALATVMADVSGRANSYNNAWFRFLLRSSATLSMSAIPGTTTSDLTIVQKFPYTGDITVMYHFIADGNSGIGEMAQAYQSFLIDEGVLVPLTPNISGRSLYLDVIGGADVRRHILGTPFVGIEAMTNADDMRRFVDVLSENGVGRIQMPLHGWFNRGVNHDAAKNINLIRSVASRDELQEIDEYLGKNGYGSLFPAVNLQTTNWFSRNINKTFEAARDAGGFYGYLTHVSRDSLSSRFSQHRNAFSLLIHPAVLPMHIDEFLPAFEKRVGRSGIMLTDLGDILTESLYMRDSVDREHSRLIAESQIRRVRERIPSILVSGGNDYSLAFAKHLVDVPTEADMFMLIDYEVPFYSMVVHGFIEFAGSPANMRENFDPETVLLNSMATGASPRYIVSAQPTRNVQSSPHERFYSTQFENWQDTIIEHYRAFNEVYGSLLAERITDFVILQGGERGRGTNQVSVTVFGNGTRIYVNQTREAYDTGEFIIEPRGFVVREGV
jgi:hypothetical protein